MFGRAVAHALLDEVEIEHEIERGEDHDEHAEQEPDWPVRVNQRHLDSEEAEGETNKIHDEDSARRRGHAKSEVLSGLNHSGPVGDEERAERAECEKHRLADDAWICGLGEHRDAAERNALEPCVNQRGVLRPRVFEHGHQHHDETGDARDQNPDAKSRIVSPAVPDVQGCD